jgi:hypothetical protein
MVWGVESLSILRPRTRNRLTADLVFCDGLSDRAASSDKAKQLIGSILRSKKAILIPPALIWQNRGISHDGTLSEQDDENSILFDLPCRNQP